MTDQPSNYAADVECAIGLNVGGDRADRVYAARDAVLAVRDREVERLRARLDAAEKLHQAHLRVEQRLAREQLTAEAAIERVRKLVAHPGKTFKVHDFQAHPVISVRLVLDAIDQPQQTTTGVYAPDPDCETGDVRTCTTACSVHGNPTEQQPNRGEHELCMDRACPVITPHTHERTNPTT